MSKQHEIKVGDQFKLVGRPTMVFEVVRIECENGAFGPQLVGHYDGRLQTKVLAKHEGYTFERVAA